MDASAVTAAEHTLAAAGGTCFDAPGRGGGWGLSPGARASSAGGSVIAEASMAPWGLSRQLGEAHALADRRPHPDFCPRTGAGGGALSRWGPERQRPSARISNEATQRPAWDDHAVAPPVARLGRAGWTVLPCAGQSSGGSLGGWLMAF